MGYLEKNMSPAETEERKPRRGTQVVGNVGMFYAAYRLSQMGWNVMPTSRNARGIDLLAYDERADRKLGIQIKALTKRDPVPLGKSVDGLMATGGSSWPMRERPRRASS